MERNSLSYVLVFGYVKLRRVIYRKKTRPHIFVHLHFTHVCIPISNNQHQCLFCVRSTLALALAMCGGYTARQHQWEHGRPWYDCELFNAILAFSKHNCSNRDSPISISSYLNEAQGMHPSDVEPSNNFEIFIKFVQKSLRMHYKPTSQIAFGIRLFGRNDYRDFYGYLLITI